MTTTFSEMNQKHLSPNTNPKLNPFLATALAWLVACSAWATVENQACLRATRLREAGGGTETRHYAPDREVRVLHLALDVTPNFQQRTLQGTAVLRLQATAKPVREIQLDAVDLKVQSLTATEPIQAYQVTDDQILVTFLKPLAPDQEVRITCVYSAEPARGLYFRTPEEGYREGDTHLFSQGEEIEARHWFPCLDSPNQRFTSEITCRVPAGMTVISNGRLVSETTDPATGLSVIHWSQEKPHANYLISLLAGYFKKLSDRHGALPLSFYTPPSEFAEAASSFRDTKDMVAFFEREIGVLFPWAKYDQVCVNDFVAGGMENTSVTTLTDQTLFTAATENLRNSEGLISHELAHQWFGDLVTCKDWSHVWLNEGFATYYETLYDGFKNGREALLYELYQRARSITGNTSDNRAIVRRNFGSPGEMFDYLSYPKAGWVLHMLRCDLGEELYRRCVKTYLERHALDNVVTEDFRAVIEELSGRSYDQFFDQWLYHGHQPELQIAYSWDETSKLAKLSVQQLQEVNASVLLFNVPLTFRFKGAFGTIDQPIRVSRKQEDFYFPLASAPELVRVDPEYTLLAKIVFDVPRSMLEAQLADTKDVIGRLLAIEQLATRRDHDAVAKLKKLLNQDAFHGVRQEAARALRSIRTEEALEALLASTEQSDARVREQVVEALGGFYSEKACAAARQVLTREKNPGILAAAIRNLGGYAQPDVQGILLKNLHADSYRNELADAAVAALREQDDPAAIPSLLDVLAQRESAFTSHGLAQGITTLAYLARKEESKDTVREFLLARVNHKKLAVQLAVISALGTLGDSKALPVLETFANASKTSPQRAAAERAVAEVRASRRPADDFKNLRQEVLELKKLNRDLRQDLDQLKQKFEARNPKVEVRAPKPEIRSPKSQAKQPVR